MKISDVLFFLFIIGVFGCSVGYLIINTEMPEPEPSYVEPTIHERIEKNTEEILKKLKGTNDEQCW